jgi:hypothetical protein
MGASMNAFSVHRPPIVSHGGLLEWIGKFSVLFPTLAPISEGLAQRLRPL